MPEYPASVRLPQCAGRLWKGRALMQRVQLKLISGAESVLTRFNLHEWGCVPVLHSDRAGVWLQQTLQRAGSRLTLGFINSTCQDGYFSGKVAVNSPEQYCITCDKSLTAFLAALQL